ncbi:MULTISPECIES: phage tail assembly chaperone [Megasphaera]|uniref:Phage XkdN-like protein n=1 Tax=Megasphaera vaginalis (ex Srinivasan et al. 2021) TaxID=1111454 RepID=U7UP97_9FIRM|nr:MULTISPECIES: phage XkdN-like protein [Megasphaera]ERT61267.1 phage XkdN-like protein [Megasphaera vaginalis (ex Srinivasan et al. 2021)]
MEEKLTLSAFLKENSIEKLPVEYVASKRFVINGDPVAWKLRCLSNDELDELTKKCTKNIPIKGTRDFKKELDRSEFANQMAIKSVVFPDLNDADLQNSYGVVGAEDLLRAMLTPGEFADLILAVNEASDYNSGMNDKIKTAKN